ncbi:MAG: hypothetical protein AAGD47_06910, partial [Pseudomonadota bacterium]
VPAPARNSCSALREEFLKQTLAMGDGARAAQARRVECDDDLATQARAPQGVVGRSCLERTDLADQRPGLGGEIIIAFDPARLGGSGAVAHGERLFQELLSQGGTRIPGGRRDAIRARADRDGVEVAVETLEKIRAL